jgi:hypothetical protein
VAHIFRVAGDLEIILLESQDALVVDLVSTGSSRKGDFSSAGTNADNAWRRKLAVDGC